MEKKIISKWNEKIKYNDTVYVLGDVFYGNKTAPQAVLEKLVGHKHLIVGNHDYSILLKNKAALDCFESVSPLLKIDDNDRMVILCHYPIITWDKKHYGSYHVYGHVHSHVNSDTIYMLKQERAYNCGCMINNYEPCTLEELSDNKRLFIEKNHIQL